jgi:hypothetical protein
MRPAFVERTREEVMAGIHAESKRLGEERAHKTRQPAASKNGKPRVVISAAAMSGLLNMFKE